MTLNPTAEQTAKDLLNALRNNVIENYLEFVDASAGTDKFITLLPISGVLKPEQFNSPSFYDLGELAANRLIKLSQGTTSHGGTKWTVTLTGALNQLFEQGSAQPSEAVGTEIIAPLPRIFVSYSSEDTEIRDRIVRRLRKAYENVWAADKLRGGDEWWREILRRIHDSDIFLYLLSRDSMTSLYCRAEFSEAVRLRKQIIPVHIRSNMQIPGFLSMYQLVNMLNATDNPDNVADLFAAIIKKSMQVPQRPMEAIWSQAVSLPSELIRIKVHATKDPLLAENELNTGILLVPGDELIIKAEGKVSINDGSDWMDPAGRFVAADQPQQAVFVWNRNAYRMTGYPQEEEQCKGCGVLGCLFGWVGEGNYDRNRAFFVGEYLEKVIKSGEEGFLYLAVNDERERYGNNYGDFSVTISVHRQDHG